MIKIRKRRLGLAAQFGLLFFATALILILLLSVTLFSYFHNNVENSLLSSLSQTVSARAQSLSDLLTRLDLYMNLVTDSTDIFLTPMLQYDGRLFPAYQNYLSIRSLLKTNLDVTFGSRVPTAEVFLFIDHSMPLSEIISSYSMAAFRQKTISSAHISLPDPFENEDWYQNMLARPDEDYWFTLDYKPGSLCVIRALNTSAVVNGRVVSYNMGSLLITFEADDFNQDITDSNLGEATLLLLDSSGVILHSSNSLYDGRTLESLSSPGRSETQLVFDGTRSYLWKNELPSGLTLVTLLPYRQIRTLTMGSMRIIFIVGLLLMTAGLGLIVLLSRYATRPISRLAEHMQYKNLTPLPLPGPRAATEIDYLYSSFNGQIAHINRLIDEVRRSEQQRKEIEIQLLQAQINPHFVCNTLGTVCCRSLMQGDDELADILSDLADFMRYNLREPSARIPLSRELEVIRRYMRIQQSCGKDISLGALDIAEDCLSLPVPKLILQPIVENALSHTDDPASVRLFIRRRKNRLIMRVENHSPGTDTEQINAHLSGRITLSSKSTGLGIRNINQRLHLSYGDEYGLTFYALPGDYIAAELIMPIEAPPAQPLDS